ncbi:MAG: hypothetical protein FWG30_11985 [Eubacteriaceae bacterium]|nr:hypothetical protein [Eubacteriaceae bacterium]
MISRILRIILATLALMLLQAACSPKRAPVASEEALAEGADDTQARMAAYCSAIDSLISEYGEGTTEVKANEVTLNGLGYVRLIDFDGDGRDELICAYSKLGSIHLQKLIVYGYDDGLVVLLSERNMPSEGTSVSPVVKLLEKGGKTYLVYGARMFLDVDYFGLVDGEMVSHLHFYNNSGYIGDEMEYSLNGIPTTFEELRDGVKAFEAGGTVTETCFYGKVIDIDGTPYGLLPETLEETRTTVKKIQQYKDSI